MFRFQTFPYYFGYNIDIGMVYYLSKGFQFSGSIRFDQYQTKPFLAENNIQNSQSLVSSLHRYISIPLDVAYYTTLNDFQIGFYGNFRLGIFYKEQSIYEERTYINSPQDIFEYEHRFLIDEMIHLGYSTGLLMRYTNRYEIRTGLVYYILNVPTPLVKISGLEFQMRYNFRK